MIESTHYGQMSSEKHADENQTCRQIVREIANFGINQRQQLMIIYLLALELENIEHMKAITTMIKDLNATNLFIASDSEED